MYILQTNYKDGSVKKQSFANLNEVKFAYYDWALSYDKDENISNVDFYKAKESPKKG